MSGSRSPCVYLAPLWRYGASNVGSTDVDTDKKKKEGKEKEEGREREEKREVEMEKKGEREEKNGKGR